MERQIIYHKSSSTSTQHTPNSFSSSLLDSIYRSIDDEEVSGSIRVPGEMVSYKDLTLNARKNRSFRAKEEDEEAEVKASNLRRVEKWMMEKKRSSEKASMMAMACRESSSAAAVLSNSNSNSSSSSSDSSFWSGGLSSSESEYSFHCPKSMSSSSSSCYSLPRPKPVRTERNSNGSSSQKPKKQHHDHEQVLAKTKSKALKIYAELKKAKARQPISPGGRLASFLNSLFANSKRKPKISVSEPFGGTSCDESSKVKYSKSKSTPAYCPSSASSYSRSCISKTPSSTSGAKTSTKIAGPAKRSVRFDPVSVIILDEDSQPCGHKSLQVEDDQLKIHVMEENRQVAEAARKLLESYRRTKASYDPKECDDDLSEDEEEEDDDDGASCSSSDLFELDNLSAIGIERFREELPVYETTNVGTNRAIAGRLIL